MDENVKRSVELLLESFAGLETNEDGIPQYTSTAAKPVDAGAITAATGQSLHQLDMTPVLKANDVIIEWLMHRIASTQHYLSIEKEISDLLEQLSGDTHV